ncbi:hypothetical protein L9F63_005042, partial [Diploptera punctata]
AENMQTNIAVFLFLFLIELPLPVLCICSFLAGRELTNTMDFNGPSFYAAIDDGTFQ